MSPGLPASFSVSALGRRQPPKDERAQREPRAGALRGAARTSNTSSTFILETQRNGGRAPQGARAGAALGRGRQGRGVRWGPLLCCSLRQPRGSFAEAAAAGSRRRGATNPPRRVGATLSGSEKLDAEQPPAEARAAPAGVVRVPCEHVGGARPGQVARARQLRGVRALHQRGLSRRLLCGKLTLNFEITWLTFFF